MLTGLASTALVLSIAAPFGGQNWYYLTFLSPLSGFYYWQRGTRQEEVQVLLHHLSPILLALAGHFLAGKPATTCNSCTINVAQSLHLSILIIALWSIALYWAP